MPVVWLCMKMFLDILSNRFGKWQVISKEISFYKTESYNMTRKAFVKEDEWDKLNFGYKLPEDVKEETVLEESSEMEL